jgi:hypothetical protein
LTDPNSGEPVADGSYTMTFRLYDSESGSSELWTETKDISVQDGVFSTILGDKTALDQGLFDSRALWLGVKVGADPEMTPRQRILPVAYALSLIPGAVISTTSDSAILELINAGPRVTLAVTNTVQDGIWGFSGDSNWAAGVGGYSESSLHGMGVQGIAAPTSGEGYGVWGKSHAPSGAGVYGATSYDADFWEASGVMGYSIYTNTAGVYGESEHGNGVFGKANSGSRSGVVGWNEGAASGVYGVSDQGHGVSGRTDDTAGGYEHAGVYGRSTHTETLGVLGESEYGVAVLGRISEPDNWQSAVAGQHFGGGPGVTGYSQSDDGVEGYSDSDHGVYGETRTDRGGYEWAGVKGRSTHTETFGVLGESDYGTPVEGRSGELNNVHPAVSGWNYGGGPGVRGYGANDVGVAGYSDNSDGIYGQTSAGGVYEFAGVKGTSTYSRTFGVWGSSQYGVGVEGFINEATNLNPALAGYNVGGGDGVQGYSQSKTGVRGEGASYGGHFVNTGGTALRADGDVEVNGNLTVTGTVTGGAGTTLPIAYGFVNADGSLASGSSSVSSRWSSRDTRYEVSISGHSYFYSDYVTLVTVSAPCSPAPCAAQTDSASGKLLIRIADGSGSTVQANFQFVTYKP